MPLDSKVLKEAGKWQEIIAPLFDEILLGHVDMARINRTAIILDILRRTKSEECYEAYEHLYNNILSVGNVADYFKLKGKDSSQDS